MVHLRVLPIILFLYTFILYININVILVDSSMHSFNLVESYYKARKMKIEQELMDKKIDLYKRALRSRQAAKDRATLKKVIGIRMIRSPSERIQNNLISTIWLGGVPFQDPLMTKKNKSRKDGINKRRHFILQYKNENSEWIVLLNFVMIDFYIYTRSTFNQIDQKRLKLKSLALENDYISIRACKRGTSLCTENTFSSQILIDISERKASFLVNVGSISCPYGLSHIVNDVIDFNPIDEPPDKSVVDDIVKIYVPLVNRGILTPKCKNRSVLPLENLTADFEYPPLIFFSSTIVILGNIIARKLGLIN